MNVFVFLSHPRPATKAQAQLIATVTDYLAARGFVARTLGVTDYDMNAPLTAIRRVLLECNGVMSVALRRMLVQHGQVHRRTESPKGELEETLESVTGAWLTSPWTHIELAMAYQLGLPIVHVRERDVLPDGVLESGVLGLCGPGVDLDAQTPAEYLGSPEWITVSGQWEGYVRAVFDRKGWPTALYGWPSPELRG